VLAEGVISTVVLSSTAIIVKYEFELGSLDTWVKFIEKYSFPSTGVGKQTVAPLTALRVI
jgi:hypothetical protein